jgi:pyruvate/2-oxoglutarate/acetoin dehydrogenase E1 component
MTVISYSQAIRDALREEMRRDERVFLLGEDIGTHGGAFGVTRGLIEEFSADRVIDTPISEEAIVGSAVGSALAGRRPVAEIMYMDFITLAMDQLVNQAAKMHYMFGGKATVPMVVRTPAGGVGRGNAAQHMQSLEAWFCHVPGLKVVMPSTPQDAKGLLKSAIRDNNPIVFVEHKLLYATKGEVPDQEYTIPLGSAEVKRSGENVTVIATSRMVLHCLEAAERLDGEGLSVEVIDPRTLVPLDIETIIESVKRTHMAIVVHEAPRRGGFGAEVAAQIQELAFDWLDAPVGRICGEDVPIPFSKTLEAMAVPDPERIAAGIRKALGR